MFAPIFDQDNGVFIPVNPIQNPNNPPPDLIQQNEDIQRYAQQNAQQNVPGQQMLFQPQQQMNFFPQLAHQQNAQQIRQEGQPLLYAPQNLPQVNRNQIPFQQMPNVDPEIQNHGMMRHYPQQELLYRELRNRTAHLSSYQTNYARRAKQNGHQPHLRSELHSLSYKPPYRIHQNPFTGEQSLQLEDTSLEDNILAHCIDPVNRNRYAEKMYTRPQSKLLTKLQFSELKKQSVTSLSETCLDKLVHSYAAKIITEDVLWRIIEERWDELKDVLNDDEFRMLGVIRSIQTQLDDGVYTTATRAETSLLKICTKMSKAQYPIKRGIATSLNSTDPLVTQQQKLLLKSTSRKSIDPLLQASTEILKTAPEKIMPSSLMAQEILNQIPPQANKRKKL